MGMNKKYVPQLDRLKIELDDSPENIRYYRKADSLVGPADSIEYLKLRFNKE